MDAPLPLDERPVLDTRRWLERAVIGLNLCPFAKAVLARGQVHFACAPGEDFAPVTDALVQEAQALIDLDAGKRDTTLLVVPRGFDDWFMFLELVRAGERALKLGGYQGVLQLASFHPRFVFAGSDDDDPGNRTNRSPWPLLHLLREESIERAVQAFPDPAAIYEANIRTLSALGDEGWAALGVQRA
jgi:uncharacterized protein